MGEFIVIEGYNVYGHFDTLEEAEKRSMRG